ncbi:3beta,22alpha-dihydroxysteroid 3-dehydrogenase-like isoform X1 [Lotus japonicus]|uniref:Cytochrome P450 monooxygenase n=1 Tax=Lotus japonicus TaxID=34305 RepID=A0A6F8PJQ1_LOTJA|nr:3beta,22alpha-dihydroxysteroid 3-dehydrogenase-like isoform X1 [Lotus japonicus]BBO93647.1 cytochrome P450 monooxygenase [Lotus japonicus]
MLNLSREELVIVVALLCVGITYLASKACKRASSNEREDIPGRLGLPFIGETFSFLSAYNSTRGSYDFVTPRRLRFGRWFKTRLFGKIHIFVPNSEGARIILANDFVLFNKGYVKSLAEAAGKNSLFCVPVESHKRMRRLLSEPFSMTSPSAFITKFDKKMCARLQKLEEGGQSFKVLDFCMKMSFDGICEMLMSITEDSLLEKIWKDSIAAGEAMISIPAMIPGSRYYKGMKARRRLVETFTEIIARRRRGEESAEDFLQSMLQRDLFPASEKLDDSEIIDNMLTFIFSGQSTTATAMMWSVKFLHENKEVQDILREEQLSLSKMKPEGAPLTKEDINNMPYGWKVLKETLRMSNIVLWYPRVALQDCTIEGREIKKGWHVNIDATCVHFDPDLYKDPLKFNPQRFDETQKPYSFIPFGAGPRTCLGMYMAKLKMLIFIHRLVGGYTWTLDDLDNSLQAKELVPKLRSGCPITLKSLSKSRSEA